MAQYTPNFNLYEPDSTDDFADFRTEFNNNMNIIDQNLGGGGGSGGHTIVDENGSDMPAESKLQFTGNVSVTDDNVNGATVVDVLGGGGNVYGAFLDPSRIIKASESVASGTTSTYSATEDCAVHIVFVGSTNPSRVYIDGVELETHYASQLAFVTHVLYVRKGQVFSLLSGDNSTNYTVYGLLQGTNGIYAPVIYSDNERVIGVWRDNKPLYQKTLVYTVTSTISSNTVLGSISDIDTVASIEGIAHYEGHGRGWLLPMATSSYSSNISYNNGDIILNIANDSYGVGWVFYVTVQYTKTTDVAGSGNWNTDGVPTHHYSTSEQVIGTYFGKPLYEKTWDFPTITVSSVGAWISTSINASDMALLVDVKTRDNNVVWSGISAVIDGGIIKLINTTSQANLGVSKITLQYTKVTD